MVLFPKFYQQIKNLNLFKNSEFFNLGSGGFNGFNEAAGHEIVGTLAGGHGAALDLPENRSSIRDFVLRGVTSNLPQYDEKGVLEILSNIAWLIWLFILVLLVGIGYGIWKYVRVVRRVGVRGFVAIYAGLILIVLNTV